MYQEKLSSSHYIPFSLGLCPPGMAEMGGEGDIEGNVGERRRDCERGKVESEGKTRGEGWGGTEGGVKEKGRVE